MVHFGLLAALTLSSVTDCSKGASEFKISSLSFLPDPPVKGENSTLSVSMMVPQDVSGGTATYAYKYNFIPMAPEVKDLCGEVPGGCPIKAGSLDLVNSFQIPSELSGSLTVTVTWKDVANVQLLCVAISFKV
jgi:hypothetical protein